MRSLSLAPLRCAFPSPLRGRVERTPSPTLPLQGRGRCDRREQGRGSARAARTTLLAALLALPAQAAPPTRVASLNLCTDELALELAAPHQLASVTFLAADPHETSLAPLARGLHHNNGRMDTVAALAPDLVLTSGPATRYAAELAARMGARVLDVAPPQTIADVRANIRAVAAALGREPAGTALIARFDRDLGRVPPHPAPALLLEGGGYVPRPDGLAAQFLVHAGLAQQPMRGNQADIETLLTHPPAILLTSRYRANQTSNQQAWLQHPALARLPSRRLSFDGRAWTCMGPLAARALPGLRTALAR